MTSPEISNILQSDPNAELINAVMHSSHDNKKNEVDINVIQRESSRLVIDEVYRVLDMSTNSSDVDFLDLATLMLQGNSIQSRKL